MPKASPAILGFSTGLNAPSTTGRIDLSTYSFGCLVFDNFLAQVEGPAVKRPGTKFIAPAKFDDKETRVMDFEFSNEQPYTLEFGELYMRVFRQQSLVLDPNSGFSATVLSITAANPMVVTVASHSILVDQHVFLSGTDIAEINGSFFRVTAVTATTLSLEFDSSTLTAQPGPSGTVQAVFEIVTPYAETDIRTIKTAPSIDVLYLVAPGIIPQKLIRLADDNWTIGPIWTSANLENTEDDRFGLWPPFSNLEIAGSITLTVAADVAPGATTTITASASLFVAGDVGRFIQIKGQGAASGFAEITTFTTDVLVTVTMKSRFSASVIATATKNWAWGAFDSTNGFPRAVSFFEDRLFFAGTDELPQSWWASKSGAFENFRPYDDDGSSGFTIAADSAIFNTINSDKQNAIEWMLGQETLFAGTRGGEFTIEGANIEQGIQPGNLFVKKRASFGSRKDVQAVAVDTVVLFVQRAGRRIRELAFRIDVDQYVAPDMNRMSREAVFGRIREMSYQQEPNRVLWCAMEDGTFASFTYEREERVTAWATHTLGGASVLVESVAVVPSPNDDEDEVWEVVNRTFDGTTTQSIEIFNDFWDRTQVLEDTIYLDSVVSFSLAQTTVMTSIIVSGTKARIGFGAPHSFAVDDIIECATDPNRPTLVGKQYKVTEVFTLLVTIADVSGGAITDIELVPSVGSTVRPTQTTVTGAIHLAGQTVGLVTGGKVQPDVTVDSVGTFTMPNAAGQGYVGHRYESRLRTNRLEAGAADGVAQGKTKRIHRLVIRLDQTGEGLFIGTNFDDSGVDATMDAVELTLAETVTLDQAIPLFDGDTKSLTLPGKFDQEGTIAIRHSEPLPCTIIALFPQLNTQDR